MHPIDTVASGKVPLTTGAFLKAEGAGPAHQQAVIQTPAFFPLSPASAPPIHLH